MPLRATEDRARSAPITSQGLCPHRPHDLSGYQGQSPWLVRRVWTRPRVENQRVVPRVSLDAVDRGDVGMIERGGQLGFAAEARAVHIESRESVGGGIHHCPQSHAGAQSVLVAKTYTASDGKLVLTLTPAEEGGFCRDQSPGARACDSGRESPRGVRDAVRSLRASRTKLMRKIASSSRRSA